MVKKNKAVFLDRDGVINKAIIKNSHSILEKGLKDLNKEISEINSLSSVYKKLELLND